MKSLFQGLMSKSKKKQKGMTLVELLAVIVILGVVAGIGTIAVGNIIENAREDAVTRQEEMISQAVRLYLMDNDTTTAPTSTQLAPYYEGDADLSEFTITVEDGKVTVEHND